MIYLQGYNITFQEVPDEVSLVLLIGDCPHHCPGCHSPQMQKPEGRNLIDCLDDILSEYENAITCVCFMGEGQDFYDLFAAIRRVKERGYKVCLYTGYYFDYLIEAIRKEDTNLLPRLSDLDYLKDGPYIKRYGGLDREGSNQHMYRIQYENEYTWHLTDISDQFRKKETL